MDINIHIHQEPSSKVRDFSYSLPTLTPRLANFTYDELIKLRSILVTYGILKFWNSKFDSKAEDRLRRMLNR